MKATFSRNLVLGFGLSLVLLIVSSVSSIVSIHNLLSSADWVSHTNLVIEQLQRLASSIDGAKQAQMDFLLTGKAASFSQIPALETSARESFERSARLTSDNLQQQQSMRPLSALIERQLSIIRSIFKNTRGSPTTLSLLEEEHTVSTEFKRLIAEMEERERRLLRERSSHLADVSSFTSGLVIIAGLISLASTLFFFLRIQTDFRAKEALEKKLLRQEDDTRHRIAATQAVAERIAGGDYSLQIDPRSDEALGGLTEYLNKMSGALERSFKTLSDNEWMGSALNGLSSQLLGEKPIERFSKDVIRYVSQVLSCPSGIFYLTTQQHLSDLYAAASVCVSLEEANARVLQYQPVIEAFELKKTSFINTVSSGLSLFFGNGELKIGGILCLPVIYEGRSIGVMEFGVDREPTSLELLFLQKAADSIGIALHAATSRKTMQSLLEETQAQSEELLIQHTELESMNTELEENTQRLQASEEELKVQQVELIQANLQLEERSRLLEDKNQLISDKNLDIQKKSEELVISTRYKSEFMANMSHELRTPLNSILLLSRLLAENTPGNLTNEQVESCQVILKSGNGLLTLIDEILDLSKIEAGKMTLEFEPVLLLEIKDSLMSLFSPVAEQKRIDLQFYLEPSLPTALTTDRLRLEQILRNLISNALKFTSSGSIRVNVTADAKRVRFAIADTGIGIAPEKKELIFEAFQQADGTTSRKYGGTGLGLSISRELARLLGGTILLESSLEEGSTFTLVLPHKMAEDSEQPVVTAASPGLAPQPGLVAEVIPSGVPDDRDFIKPGDPCILIVEDDIELVKIIIDYLHSKSLKCVSCVRGDLAFDLARRYNPSAILLDIVLPVHDGWQVLEHLKTDAETKGIPVHIMSSLYAKKESLLRGAVDFINKPFIIEQLTDILNLKGGIKMGSKKVLIVEENERHARALAIFLETHQIRTRISKSSEESRRMLRMPENECVILDMGLLNGGSKEVLKKFKTAGDDTLAIIVFTSKHLSATEQNLLMPFVDSIIIKSAFSYQRIVDDVNLFLRLINGTQSAKETKKHEFFSDVLKGRKILLVDDDVRNIFSLTRSLEQNGMTVESALDGKEALAKLESELTPDVILMDMMMPVLDGFQTIEKIKVDKRFAEIPILAVTAKASMGDREKCIAAGASDFISKPVDLDQLVSLLRVWMYDRLIA